MYSHSLKQNRQQQYDAGENRRCRLPAEQLGACGNHGGILHKRAYLAEQYSGFLGQMVVPAISRDEAGGLGGLEATIAAVQKRFTSDPLISNDVVGSVYDNAAFLTCISSCCISLPYRLVVKVAVPILSEFHCLLVAAEHSIESAVNDLPKGHIGGQYGG